jgi:hypothetical protein
MKKRMLEVKISACKVGLRPHFAWASLLLLPRINYMYLALMDCDYRRDV